MASRHTTDAPSTTRCIDVRWRLAGGALLKARPELDFGDGDISLCVRITLREGSAPTARAFVESPDGATCPIETVAEGGDSVVEGSLHHLELPGLIAATIDVGAEPPRLLYARTPVIERLGLAPGTYEPAGCVTSSSNRR